MALILCRLHWTKASQKTLSEQNAFREEVQSFEFDLLPVVNDYPLKSPVMQDDGHCYSLFPCISSLSLSGSEALLSLFKCVICVPHPDFHLMSCTNTPKLWHLWQWHTHTHTLPASPLIIVSLVVSPKQRVQHWQQLRPQKQNTLQTPVRVWIFQDISFLSCWVKNVLFSKFHMTL